MPLVFAPLGVELTIVNIITDDKTKKHLQDLGVTIQGKITVVSSKDGDLICDVHGIRVALNKDTAMRIFVA